jgi:hypothetical protein
MPRRPSTKKMYFTQEHEQAIIDYCNSSCNKIRTDRYVKLIQPAFDQMVDKIVFTYKFTTLPNIDELRCECKVWLTTILEKYDPNKGSKAFSYFSVITKNWFIHKVKQTSKRAKREVDYEDALKEVDEEKIVCYNEWENEEENRHFWLKLWEEIDSWSTDDMKESEKKVFEAVKILLSSIDEIEIFNKKAIYLYLRELTGMNTKQVVSQLNKIRKKYRLFKEDWDNGKI